MTSIPSGHGAIRYAFENSLSKEGQMQSHEIMGGRSAGAVENPLGDPTRGRDAGTPANPLRDPTWGRGAGTPDNPLHDPTRGASAGRPENPLGDPTRGRAADAVPVRDR
jgi:hypothetical protein